MPGPFQRIEGEITEEQVIEIVKTGQVPSHLKSPEDKVYYVIFRSYNTNLFSNLNDSINYSEDDDELLIDGECILGTGRLNMFRRIMQYLTADVDYITDLDASTVMVEGVDAAKGVSLNRFINLCLQKYPGEYDDIKPELDLYQNYKEAWKSDNVPHNYNGPAVGLGGNAGTVLNNEEE